MKGISKLTHVLALGAAAVYGFILSPAGQAVLKQYPHLEPVVTGIVMIAGLYFSPKAAKS